MKWQLDKEKFKRLIDDTVLFSLNRELEPTAYKRESYKLIENIVGYMLAIDEESNKEFGMEIAEVAKRCIRYYEISKGSFLSYFLSSWRIELGRLKAKERLDREMGGGHITEEDKRNIRKLIRYAQYNGFDYHSYEFIKKSAEVIGLSVKEVRQLINLSDIRAVSDIVINDEGEEFSLIDIQATEETTYEDIVGSLSVAIELLKRIEKVYKERQERQKPLLSKLLTLKILEEVEEYEMLYEEAVKLEFFDNEMYINYKNNKTIPTAREIASLFKTSEQSVSRTYKNFIEIIKNNK